VQQTGANTFLTSEVEEAFNQLGVPVREGRFFTSSGWSWIASPKEQKMIPCSASFSR
jgi:hypothetical protein